MLFRSVNSFFADIPRECMFIFCGLGLAVANGFIGFIDDYIKVVKKRNLGLTAPQKLILQFLVAAAFLAALIPLALKGVKYREVSAGKLLSRNLLVYGLGGIIAPFICIKIIDVIIVALHIVS